LRSLSTVFDPISPVPPTTTIFIVASPPLTDRCVVIDKDRLREMGPEDFAATLEFP
jgi:hypothetical protein